MSRLASSPWLWGLVLGLAALLRGLTAPGQGVLLGDETYYHQVAVSIAEGNGHRFGPMQAWRPPLHPWMLSHLVEGSMEESLARMRGQQLVWGVLLVAVTGLLARELFGPRAGPVAAVIAAVHPELIAFSHSLWSENLFAVLVGMGMWSVLRMRGGSWGRALTVGPLFALATLTREIALPVLVVLLVWLLITSAGARRRVLAQGTVALVLALAVVAPWTVRNHRVLDRFVPVSTVGWFALAEGNSLESDWRRSAGPAQDSFRGSYYAERSESRRLDLARRWTVREIRKQQPGWVARKSGHAVALLLSPDSYLFLKLSREAYGPLPTAAVRVLMLGGGAFILLTLGAGAAGIAAAPRRERWFALLIVLLVLALHIVANAATRFRVPWTPLLIAAAAAWMVDPVRLRAIRVRTWWAIALAVAVVTWVVVPAVAPNARVLWSEGTAAGTAYLAR